MSLVRSKMRQNYNSFPRSKGRNKRIVLVISAIKVGPKTKHVEEMPLVSLMVGAVGRKS